jgi:hypothetical protein
MKFEKSNNALGLPEELIPIMVENWSCEYASLKLPHQS